MKWIEFFFSRNIFWIFFCIFPHNFCFVHCFGVPRKGQIVFCFFFRGTHGWKKKFQKKKREKVEIIFVISPTAQHLPKKKNYLKKKNYWTHTGFGIDNRIGSISKNSHFVILGWGRKGAKKKFKRFHPKTKRGVSKIFLFVCRASWFSFVSKRFKSNGDEDFKKKWAKFGRFRNCTRLS